MIPENVEVAIRRMRTLADSALGSLYEVECQGEMRNACVLLEDAYKEPGPLVAKIEAEARRYAGMYPEASDGRNTFVLFADYVARLAAQPPAAPVETDADLPTAQDVRGILPASIETAGDTIAEAWSVLEEHGFPPEACEYLPAAIDNAITALVGAREDLLAEVLKLRAPPNSSADNGELLPCPHCGGKADFNNDGERWHQVICGSCGCRGCEYPDDRTKAAAAWNRRDTRDLRDKIQSLEILERHHKSTENGR